MQTNQCLTPPPSTHTHASDEMQMIIECFMGTPITLSPTKGCYVPATATTVCVTIQQSMD